MGYSGKPLFDKLNLKAQHTVGVRNPPAGLSAELAPLSQPPRDLIETAPVVFDAALLFATDPGSLEEALTGAMPRMDTGGLIWLCWPKKTLGISATLTEAEVRRIGLETGWVDVKVCAIDAQCSGLKFVQRRNVR